MNIEKRTKTPGSGRQPGTKNKVKAPVYIVITDAKQAARLIAGREFYLPNNQEKSPC